MTIDLSKVEFTYGFFSTAMPDGSTIILNNVSEDFMADDVEVVVKQINIIIQEIDTGANLQCSSVIGVGNSRLIIKSDYTEYLGKVLTEDNMKYCTIEMYEEENE